MDKMSNIPKARDLLDQAIKHIENGDSASARSYIGQARLLMRRVKHRPSVAPSQFKTPTKEEKEKVARYALNNPEVSYSKISEKFKMNIGRVSEAVRDFML